MQNPAIYIIRTEMSRLNDAINTFILSHTKIGFSLVTERLFYPNYTTRESYDPPIMLNSKLVKGQNSDELFIKTALQYLSEK